MNKSAVHQFMGGSGDEPWYPFGVYFRQFAMKDEYFPILTFLIILKSKTVMYSGMS